MKALSVVPYPARNLTCDLLYILGPSMHWTSNYGTGTVFIGNMLSWLSFHNFV